MAPDIYSELGWKHVATVLYNELKRWGWGDMHYGSQPQERSVVAALEVYEQALKGAGDGR